MIRNVKNGMIKRWVLLSSLSLQALSHPVCLYASQDGEENGERTASHGPFFSQESIFKTYSDLWGIFEDRHYFFSQEVFEVEARKGFEAFNVTRAGAACHLTSHKTDEKVLEYARPEIFSKFGKEAWPQTMHNIEYEFLKEDYTEAQAKLEKLLYFFNKKYNTSQKEAPYFIEKLKDEDQGSAADRLEKAFKKVAKKQEEALAYCGQETVFEHYVSHVLAQENGWFSYPGLIDALAYVKRVNLLIWRPEGQEGKTVVMVHSRSSQQNSQTVHLLHRQGQETYTRLREMALEDLLLRMHENLVTLKAKNQGLEKALKDVKEVGVFKEKVFEKKIKDFEKKTAALEAERTRREKFYTLGETYLLSPEKVLRDVLLIERGDLFRSYLDTKTLGALSQVNKDLKELLAPVLEKLEERLLVHMEESVSKDLFLAYITRKMSDVPTILQVLEEKNPRWLTIQYKRGFFANLRVVRVFFKFLPTLTKLDLSHNSLEKEGVQALVQGNFPNLTSLDLWGNSLGEGGIQALTQGNFPNLTELNLGYNSLRKEGAQALAQGNFPNLTSLDLRGNSLEEGGIQALTQGNFPNLTELNLGYNSLKKEGVQALAQGNFPNLTSLNLWNNSIWVAEAKALAKGTLTNLTWLDIGSNYIRDDVEVKSLLALTKLTTLRMVRSEITDEGAKALAQHPSLTSLNVWNNPGITAEGAEVLRKNTRIRNLSL